MTGAPTKAERTADREAAKAAVRRAVKAVTPILRNTIASAPTRLRGELREQLPAILREAAHGASREVAEDILAQRAVSRAAGRAVTQAAEQAAEQAAAATTALVLAPIQKLVQRVEEMAKFPVTPLQMARAATPHAIALALQVVENTAADMSERLRAAEMIARFGHANAPTRSLQVNASADIGRLSDRELLALLPANDATSAERAEAQPQALPMDTNPTP